MRPARSLSQRTHARLARAWRPAAACLLALQPLRARALVAGCLAVLAAGLVPRSAGACSICGCDPSVGTLGLERPSSRSLRLSLDDRALWKESGSGDAAESERENRLTLRAQYAPTVPLAVQLEVPVYLYKSHLDASGLQDDAAHGLGDLAASARYELLRFGGLAPKHVFAATATLKLPTGNNDRRLPGALPDEHLQLGTGSWDVIPGVAYSYGELPWTLYATAQLRLNSANGRGFRYGHALFATLGARRAFLEMSRLIVGLEGQLRAAGKDRGLQGFDDDSGGQILYATPSVAFSLTPDLLLRAVAQLPTVSALHGTQAEHPVIYAGLSYDFAL